MASPGMAQKVATAVRNNLMACLTMVSVVLAISVGIAIRSQRVAFSLQQLGHLRFVGELFLRALKCLVIPIMVSSLISALSGMEAKVFKKIGRYACLYYFMTTLISVILGITLVLIFRPGGHSEHTESTEIRGKIDVKSTSTVDTLLDLLRNLIPDNLFEATIKTTFTHIESASNASGSQGEMVVEKSDAANVMGIVFISIVVGLAISAVGDDARALRDFFVATNAVVMQITITVVKFTPVGIFFLILNQILSVSDVDKLFGNVAWFTFTALFGLFIHATLVLPAIYFIFTRRNPYKVITSIFGALLMGFGTGSSTATLPVSDRNAS